MGRAISLCRRKYSFFISQTGQISVAAADLQFLLFTEHDSRLSENEVNRKTRAKLCFIQ
jgi:hypothetical protein